MKINYSNYEEYLVAYLEGELVPAQEEEVREFLEQNPELKDELVLLQKTFLDTKEEPPVYRNKTSLMREERGRVIKLSTGWKMAGAIAAAAMMVFAIALVLVLMRPSDEPQNSVVFSQNSEIEKDLNEKENSILNGQAHSHSEELIAAAGKEEFEDKKDGTKINVVKSDIKIQSKVNNNDLIKTTLSGADATQEASVKSQPKTGILIKMPVEPEALKIAATEIRVERTEPKRILEKPRQSENTAIAKTDPSGIGEVKEKIFTSEISTQQKGLLAMGGNLLKRITGYNDQVTVEKHEVEGKKRYKFKLESEQFVFSANFPGLK
ncbi:MAG: hypothetical protein WD077_01050 [Bacteroidia bacterium]